MRRFSVLVVALALVSASCDGLPFGGGGGDQRTILVDYSHDEFASFYLFNFPKKVQVTPGMTLAFRQTWTGEPHTVTGGTLVDEAIGNDLLEFVDAFESLAGSGVPLPNPDGDVPESTTVADVLEIVEESEESEDRTSFLESYDNLIEEEDFPSREEAGDISFLEFVEQVDPKIEEAFSSLPFASTRRATTSLRTPASPATSPRGARRKKPTSPATNRTNRSSTARRATTTAGSSRTKVRRGTRSTSRFPMTSSPAPTTSTARCTVSFRAPRSR